MKWMSFRHGGEVRCGLLKGDRVCLLGDAPLQTFLSDPQAAMGAAEGGAQLALADVEVCQPIIRPGKILGIGLNYRAHATETGRTPPSIQTWFVKQSTAANAPSGVVHMPKVSDKLDYEAELAVVIGKRGRHVPADRAMEIVAGVCCGCDYSVRDWQRATPTMNMGKGFDTHAPFGPYIVSLDELGPLDDIGIRCFVNGQQRQSGHVSQMVHTIAQQIEHLTKAFTLEPGDVLFTGTPEGVGAAMDPPQFLKIGDRVRVEIDRVGHMEHEIVAEPGGAVIGGEIL